MTQGVWAPATIFRLFGTLPGPEAASRQHGQRHHASGREGAVRSCRRPPVECHLSRQLV